MDEKTIMSFNAIQREGPDGRRMLEVNGVLYEWEEGKAAADREVMRVLEAAYGPECPYCGFAPCILDSDDGANLLRAAEEMMEGNNPNKQTRFFLYRQFTMLIEGHLGRGIRKKLPECVTTEIQDSFPAEDDKYTGFKPGNGPNEDADIEE